MSGGWIELLPHPTNQVLAGERRHPQKRVTEEGVLAIGGGGRVRRGQRMARREAGARPRLQGQERALLPSEAAESWAVVETLSHCRPAPNGVENKF